LKGGLSALAVEDGHLLRWVAVPDDGVGWDCALEVGQVISAELELWRAQRLLQPLGCAGADERDDVLALGEHPEYGT
jgi:hypothetical protein